jgi:hypothetical protein
MKNSIIVSKKSLPFCRVKISRTKLFTILSVMLLWSTFFNAQNSNQKFIQSVGLDCYSTGNGLGTFYSPNLSLNKGVNVFSVGPVIQKRSDVLRGVKVGYSRILTIDSKTRLRFAEKDLIQLNFFTSLQYTNKLQLSYSTVRNETLIFGDSRQNLENIRLTTGEMNIGFELYVNITNNISWKNYIGGSVYYHFNYLTILEQQKCAPTLNLGTGLCFYIH